MLKQLFRLFSFVFVIVTLAVAWLVIDYQHFINTPLLADDQRLYYEVKPGANIKEIAKDLEERGVIKHWMYLAGVARWQGKAQLIKTGEYEFPPGTTPQGLLDQLVAGKVLKHSLTIVEGWTFNQMMHAIRRNEILIHSLKDLNNQQIMAELGWPDEHPEGRFYPDTYSFPKGMTDVAFLQRAHRAMSDYLDKEWQVRDPNLPLHTPYEALILASIVERETAATSERQTIAGVFIRRLQKNMLLQTDPTVIYGLGAAYDGNIRRSDLTTDTPYNTYVHAGLPPTPIALPGHDAIYAALHPEAGNSIFFVSRGNGTHEFTDNLADHNRAVRKYQLRDKPTETTEDTGETSNATPP